MATVRPRAIGYIRVSTTEQVSGFGLDVQEKAIRDYCKANRLRVVAVYRDEGQSGSNGLEDRVGLAEALAALKAGEAQSLVVYRLDRLARDLILQETTVERLKDQGTPVVSASEPDLDTATDDPTKVLIRQIVGAVAQYERAVIRGRMMAGKAAKVAQGGYGGGRPAYGYKASGGSLVANDDEAAVVDTVTSMRSSGESYRAIALALSDSGITTRTGGAWNPNQVRRIARRAGVA